MSRTEISIPDDEKNTHRQSLISFLEQLNEP